VGGSNAGSGGRQRQGNEEKDTSHARTNQTLRLVFFFESNVERLMLVI
jgi:hypothetical protein